MEKYIKIVLLILLTSMYFGCNKDDCCGVEENNDSTVEDETYTGSKEIKSQVELNAFGSLKYTAIDGSLTITNVNDISSLSTLKRISGNLVIGYIESFTGGDDVNNFSSYHNKELKSLKGLENLTTIGGNLIINDNKIRNIDPLRNLISIGNSIEISRCSFLENLNGLAGVTSTSIKGNLKLRWNPSLTNIDGLAKITSIKGDVWVWMNKGLKNLEGFSKISSIEKSLTIAGNKILSSVNGLRSLSLVGGDLKIGWLHVPFQIEFLGNDELKNLKGLENLTKVKGLYVFGNKHLNRLDELSNIDNLDGNLEIFDNDQLINLQGLNNIKIIKGTVIISENNSLRNLDYFVNLISIGKDLSIYANAQLSDFCGLKNVILRNEYSVYFNYYNPTQEQLRTEECSSM